jgi:hypothetical protein
MDDNAARATCDENFAQDRSSRSYRLAAIMPSVISVATVGQTVKSTTMRSTLVSPPTVEGIS